jgi:site-specific DNA recombinase
MYAAIYARVSSDKQRDDQTIQSQRVELLQWAAELGVGVPAEWEFVDDGYSGGSLVRPGLERLRDLVAEGIIQRVLIYGPDRLAREYAHQVLLLEEFRQAGAEVQFRKAPSGDTPEDKLVVQFQGMIAQYERAQILERSRRGKRHKALRGTVNVLSGAPYGFRYIPTTDACDARYELEPLEAETVRLIFSWFVNDQWSIGRVARELSSRGAVTRTGKTRWDRSVVWGMLRNPAYIGRAAYRKTHLVERKRINRSARLRQLYPRRPHSSPRRRPREEWIEIPVPQIVEPEVFEQAQVQLQRNKSLARRGAPVLLRGLLVCRGCSHALYTTSTKTSKQKLYYYRCLGTDSWRYPGGPRCQNPPLRADRLDEQVWSHVLQLLEDPALIQREITKRFDDLRTSRNKQAEGTRSVEAQLAKVDKSIGRLLDAYQEELIDLDALRARMRQLKSKRGELDHAIRQAELESSTKHDYLKLADDVGQFTAKLRGGSPLLALEDRHRVLRALVREVVVDVDRVVVRHCIPIKPSSTPPGYQRRRGRHLAHPRERVSA